MTSDDIIKRAVLSLLRRGLANYSELEQLSGRSKQIIRIWGQKYPDSRAKFLREQWEKAVARATKRAAGH